VVELLDLRQVGLVGAATMIVAVAGADWRH